MDTPSSPYAWRRRPGRNPYAAVLAGLGALDRPMHGAVGGSVHRMIEAALRDGAPAAIVEWLRTGNLSGFGHSLYPDGDQFPRRGRHGEA
jgi:citrate synthase